MMKKDRGGVEELEYRHGWLGGRRGYIVFIVGEFGPEALEPGRPVPRVGEIAPLLLSFTVTHIPCSAGE
jgi:hypothetical protein